MGRLVIGCILGMGGAALLPAAEPIKRFEFTETEMAVPIRIILYAPDNTTASDAARAAYARFRRLNAVMSDYDPNSELRRLCDASCEGNPVHVSDDLWRVLVRAMEISEMSDGAFDITLGPVVTLWRNARRTKELPSPKSLEAARENVGFRHVRLYPEQRSVELLRPKMRLDLGGIGKGYAVDDALQTLRAKGISRMLVEAGGIIGRGERPPG